MIVYGDPSYQFTAGEFCAELHALAARAAETADPARLDSLRLVLIRAGQLEQAAHDSPEAGLDFLTDTAAITDDSASAFVAEWSGRGTSHEPLRRVMTVIQQRERTGAVPLTIKVPEGFAFYSLYPEQYCEAAEQWIQEHTAHRSRRVLVVGIRSIGTSLSAVVAATLRMSGWDVCRTTVRPTGHPFDRRAEINPACARSAEMAIVVDEGPGASGSSMAAVARALTDAGFERAAISFFPGHGGEPGPHASNEVRKCWKSVRRYTVPLKDLRWGGRSLVQILADLARQLLSTDSPVEQVEDLSGGLWRQVVYADASDWPAAFALFERTKYRCTTRDGRSLLWKFAGHTGGADAASAQLRHLAAGGWTPGATGQAMGFVARPWLNGIPLRACDGNPDILRQLGRYIAASAGPKLPPAEAAGSFDRLAHMLNWNTHELLGEPQARIARRCVEMARPHVTNQSLSSCGDGRMAPVEWLRTRSGLLKVDCEGHDSDHTIIGPQPMLWDLAGSAVEWELDSETESIVAQNSAQQTNPAELLTFYRTAYAAFRAGLCKICSDACGANEDERRRLEQAQSAYRQRLERELLHIQD